MPTTLDPRLQSCIAKEQKDALDNLCNSAGFVGSGNAHLLYRGRPDSRPVSGCAGGNGNPPDSGTQDSWLTRLMRWVDSKRLGFPRGRPGETKKKAPATGQRIAA